MSLFSLLASLTIPACGWFGARGRNRVLLQTYSFVNWCCAFQFFLVCAFEVVNINKTYDECKNCATMVGESSNRTFECLSSGGETLDVSDCDQYQGEYRTENQTP